MQANSLKIVKLTSLVFLIVTPLLIIFNYEAYAARSQNTNHYQQLQKQAQIKVAYLKNQNEQNCKHLREKIQAKWNSQLKLKQQIVSKFDQILKNKIILQPTLGSYYLSNLIINVQLTAGFFSQKTKIQEQISSQLAWLNQQFKMNTKIIMWQDGMNLNQYKSCIIILLSQLKYEYIQQNIALKLRKGDYRNHYYIKQIVQQLKGLPSFAHCKFINTHCTQASIIYVNHNQEKHKAIWQADNNIFFIDEADPTLIFNILVTILGIDPFVQLLESTAYSQQAYALYQIKKSQVLQAQLQKSLTYVAHILEPTYFNLTIFFQKIHVNLEQGFRYLRNGQFISPYIHGEQQRKILNNLFRFIVDGQKERNILDQSILTDNRIGVIDIFPNDFKIGVYLPLIFIFIYPFFLKIKQGFINLYKFARNTLD